MRSDEQGGGSGVGLSRKVASVVDRYVLIDALMEWEDIHSGEIGARDITRRRHALMRLRHDAEAKHLPTGLRIKRKFLVLAERETSSYFDSMKLRQEP